MKTKPMYKCDYCEKEYSTSIPYGVMNYCGICIVKQMDLLTHNYRKLNTAYDSTVTNYEELLLSSMAIQTTLMDGQYELERKLEKANQKIEKLERKSRKAGDI